MREYTTRSDDCTNTITTVQKDNYILCIGAAIRGRYCNKKAQQKIELNNMEYSNSLTTVQKDSLVLEIKNKSQE